MFKKTLLTLGLLLNGFLHSEINTATLLKNNPQAGSDAQGIIVPIPQSELDKSWELAYQDALPNGTSVFEWIHKGENIENWSELIQIQFFPKALLGEVPSAREFSLTFLHFLKEKFPDATYEELKSDDPVIIEWRLPKEFKGEKPQIEIAAFFTSPGGVYRLAFTKKTESPLDPEVKKRWVEWFSNAELPKTANAKKE